MKPSADWAVFMASAVESLPSLARRTTPNTGFDKYTEPSGDSAKPMLPNMVFPSLGSPGTHEVRGIEVRVPLASTDQREPLDVSNTIKFPPGMQAIWPGYIKP